MIKVPYWFDVWYRNIDTNGLQASKKEVAIKKIVDNGWGRSSLTHCHQH